MDLKNQYLKLAGLDWDVRPATEAKKEEQPAAAPTQQTVEVLADAFQLAIERLAAKATQITEVTDPDVSLTYRMSGAAQAAHGYWSQIARVAGFGIKNKHTGDMLDVPYGMAFESRKDAKDYLKQAVSKDERADWSIIDWAMECVAFGTSVEGYVLKHKEKGSTHGPRFMTPQGAEEYMNVKMSPDERQHYKVDPIQLTKENVGLGMQGFVIQNKKTNAIKSGPYDTQAEAEEYLKRHTDGVTDPPFVVKKYEDIMGMSNYPNGKGVGVGESVDLDEGKTQRRTKAAGAKTLNTVLMTKKGGGHRTDKDYNRQKEKEKARKELSEAAEMDKDAFKSMHSELKAKGYEKTHSAMADDKEAGGVYYSHPESKKKAVIRKGKISYDVNESAEKVKCACGKMFTPSHGEYKRCPECLGKQHTAAEKAARTESVIVGEAEKFLLQKEKIGNLKTKSAGSSGQDSSNVGAPAYRDPAYKRPDYDHTNISDEHTLFGKEEEAGDDVPQQYGSIEVPAEVLKAVRDEIAHCRDIAAKTEEDVINTRGHSDKSWWKNTANMLQEVLDWLETGDEQNLKRAVIKMQSWENARWWNWPSELVKFMSHYGYGYKYPKLVDKFKEVKANLIPLKSA